MTVYHLGALLIAAVLVLACGMSNTCNHESMNQVIQLATVIVGGTFGHAGAQHRAAMNNGGQRNDRDGRDHNNG